MTAASCPAGDRNKIVGTKAGVPIEGDEAIWFAWTVDRTVGSYQVASLIFRLKEEEIDQCDN